MAEADEFRPPSSLNLKTGTERSLHGCSAGSGKVNSITSFTSGADG